MALTKPQDGGTMFFLLEQYDKLVVGAAAGRLTFGGTAKLTASR
jgi:hypothetical protein